MQIKVQRLGCLNCGQVGSKALVDYSVMISESQEALAKGGICQLCSYKKKHPTLLNQTVANVSISEQGGPIVFIFELDY